MKRTKTSATNAISSKSTKQVVLLLFIAIISSLGLVTGVWIAVTKPLPQSPAIQHVECFTLTTQPCPEPWQMVASQLLGLPMLETNIPKQLETPLVQQAGKLHSYQKRWPNTVVIWVQPQPIVYQIAVGQQWYGKLDSGEYAVIGTKRDNHPSFTVASSLITTAGIPTWIQQTLNAVVQVASSANMALTSGNNELVSPVELRLQPDGGEVIYILDPQDMPMSLGRLRAIVESSQVDHLASLSAELDVRVRLPVLRRLP